MNALKSLWTQSAPTFAVYGARQLLQVTLVLLTARLLGPAQLGTLATLSGVAVTLGSLSSVGQGFIVLRRGAQSDPETNRILRIAPIFTLSASVLLTLVFVAIARQLVDSSIGTGLLIAIAISDLLLLPLVTVYAHYSQGKGQTAKSQILLQTHIAFRVTALLMFLPFSARIELSTYAWIYFTSSALATLISFPWLANLSSCDDRKTPFTSLLREGIPFSLMRLCTFAPNELDKSISFRLLGASDTGVYAIASKAIAITSIPAHVIGLVFQRNVIAEHSKRNVVALQSLLTKLLTATILYSIAAGTVLFLFGPPLAIWLLGPEFSNIEQAIKLLAIATPALCMRFCIGNCLIAMRHPLYRLFTELGGFLVLLITAIAFTRSNGFQGFLAAVLASEILMSSAMLVTLIYSMKKIKSGG